ncbi:5'-3' exoribonuclease 2 Rat1 isoform X2 [Rhodnius prolixus]|uniref:5'-3' exoribonuclease 2 Rat1 isoform X2 n=1 Tax=Rhodnius prolixus TaxID=13249 RepID=UPI003D18AC12
MGVPAFFRWLTRKYPSVVVECIEEKGIDEEGNLEPVDSSKKNPNGIEFDNLYLDMNGIIHPCTHPENKPPPKNEDEMMIAIFECVDRLFRIVRPRRLLYLAIDGVAPRAKMNQQRSRRFRAAKETKEKVEQIILIKNKLESLGVQLPREKDKSFHFDSNCITPGTRFMSRLTECLHYYIHDRLMSDPGWKGLKVILSDASVPGEGEHKIMDFIRRQRGIPDYDPNTHHCLCGADADLIMLGLATHEPHFTIIREEFVMNQPKRCDICGQTGHELKECKGLPNQCEDPNDHHLPPSQTKYIFVRLNVLREYLEQELKMENLPFEYNFERALDDWVFMCFFVGNDFLPHLPSLEIREGAIDRLVNLYKSTVSRTGGFITDSGDVQLDRVQLILTDLGTAEDEIFKKRRRGDLIFRDKTHRRKLQEKLNLPENQHKSHQELIEDISKDDPEPIDDVRLWEVNYKNRYYKTKFGLDDTNLRARYKIGKEYAKGLCWVLKYYYQGCASWKWYFPYHYAPFASDIINIGKKPPRFEKFSQPFSPLEQLMSVFPAASASLVPAAWAQLMTDPLSPILDFYPTDFTVDANGKKYSWQGVALLPFVDEARLRKGLEPVYHKLTEEEEKRNKLGWDRLYVCIGADCYTFIKEQHENNPIKADLRSKGVCGQIVLGKETRNSKLVAPLPELVPLSHSVLCVSYFDPEYPEDHKFLAHRLPGSRDPPKVRGDSSGQGQNNQHNRYRPLLGMAPRIDEASLSAAGHRMLSHTLPREFCIRLGNSGNDLPCNWQELC